MENNNCDLQYTRTHTTLSDIQSATSDVATVVPMNQSYGDSTSDQPAVQVEPGGGSIKSATSEISTRQEATVNTAKFLETMDNLTDCVNSRSQYASKC